MKLETADLHSKKPKIISTSVAGYTRTKKQYLNHEESARPIANWSLTRDCAGSHLLELKSYVVLLDGLSGKLPILKINSWYAWFESESMRQK